jgi:hypothetical protein
LPTDDDQIFDRMKNELNLRSLKGENNVVTDSLKVVHQKFSPKKKTVLKSKDKLYKQTQKVKVPLQEQENCGISVVPLVSGNIQ